MTAFNRVMAAAAYYGWPVWIAPSNSERVGGYVVHLRGPISGHTHHCALPDAVREARRHLARAPRP